VTLDALKALILASGCSAGSTVAGWSTDPVVLLPLGGGLLLYLAGVARLWRTAGIGRGASPWAVASFCTGWLCLAGALISPLHELSRSLFAAHMIEHEMMMAVAAPLLVASRPLGILVWGFPERWRPSLARGGRAFAYLIGWEVLSRPLVATALHAAALWFWHIPVVFDAALNNEALHWLQHLSFFVTAIFFWWAMLDLRRPTGAALGYLFLTSLHTGFLGILLALARRPMFDGQARLAAALGVDPLADQQLAGLVMWVPAGLVYAVAGLVVGGLWIARSSVGTEKPSVQHD
jgi:putative membrane protein